MAHPKTLQASDTHRLIPSSFTRGSVLETLPLAPKALADLSEIDAATNGRLAAEHGRDTAIGLGELLSGVPYAHIVNAAFCHPGPSGGRFNTFRRGAWYAGVNLDTSLAEVAFHKKRFLQDARILSRNTFDYVDFLSDFSAEFHYLDRTDIATCLQPHPVPQCYQPSQALANSLLFAGSNGIVYPSVRHSAGACIACFRPALVYNPRHGHEYRITLQVGSDAISIDIPAPPARASTTKKLRRVPSKIGNL